MAASRDNLQTTASRAGPNPRERAMAGKFILSRGKDGQDYFKLQAAARTA
jgi:hypothetical protein